MPGVVRTWRSGHYFHGPVYLLFIFMTVGRHLFILPFTAVRHVGPSSSTAIFHGILESMTKEQATTLISILMLLTFMTIRLFRFPFQFMAVFTVCASVEPNAFPRLLSVSVHACFEAKPRRPPCCLSMHMAVGDMRAVPWWRQPREECRAQCQAI